MRRFAHQFQRSMLIPFCLKQHAEDFAYGINGPLQVDHAAIDLEIDLVQMPGDVGLWSALAQVCDDQGPEMVNPAPNSLVGNRDAAF